MTLTPELIQAMHEATKLPELPKELSPNPFSNFKAVAKEQIAKKDTIFKFEGTADDEPKAEIVVEPLDEPKAKTEKKKSDK